MWAGASLFDFPNLVLCSVFWGVSSVLRLCLLCTILFLFNGCEYFPKFSEDNVSFLWYCLCFFCYHIAHYLPWSFSGESRSGGSRVVIHENKAPGRLSGRGSGCRGCWLTGRSLLWYNRQACGHGALELLMPTWSAANIRTHPSCPTFLCSFHFF